MSSPAYAVALDMTLRTEEAAAPTPWWRRVALLRDYSILIGTLALFVVLAITGPNFLTKRNLLNILDQQTSLGIIACAGTLVIIAGGFDLSVGAMYALGGVVAAQLANHLGVAQGIIISLEQVENYPKQSGREDDPSKDWRNRTKGIEDAEEKVLDKWMPEELMAMAKRNTKS